MANFRDTCENRLNISIRADTLKSVDPSRKNFPIRLYITADSNISDLIIEEIVVKINKKMFFSRVRNSIINGSLVSNVDGLLTINNVRVPPLVAGREAVLLTVVGNLLLTDIDSSDIEILSVDFSDNTLDYSLHNGYIKFAICREEGERYLINYDFVPEIIVKNNPVTDMLEIECVVIENGNYSLEIVDILGNVSRVKEFVADVISSHNDCDETGHYKYEVPINNFGNGNYFLIMNTPTKKYSVGFVILR